MQYARLEVDGQRGLYAAGGQRYYPVRDGQGRPVDLLEAMAAGGQLAEWTERALRDRPAEGYNYLPAAPKGVKLVCVGTNYKKHLMEIGHPFPGNPVLFSKFDNALAAHGEEISLPPCAQQVDYEAELVLVIGRQGKMIPEDEALEYVFGYTCGNDLSARDLQFLTSQWLLGKTADGFAPVGPHIRTLDGTDPDSLGVSLRLNGEIRQKGNTGDMIFGCARLISFISRAVTLTPGDLIFTGTPEGVIQGYPEGERRWLKDGDVIEVEVEGLPPLRSVLRQDRKGG